MGSDRSGVLTMPHRNDLFAAVSFACACLSLLIAPQVLAPIAVVAGAIGIGRTRHDPQPYGKASAWIGLLLGLFNVLWASRQMYGY
jgi:hypothetical protein